MRFPHHRNWNLQAFEAHIQTAASYRFVTELYNKSFYRACRGKSIMAQPVQLIRTIIIGIFRCPLFRGPLIIILYVQ